ncbi:MAG: UMP kinase [Mycoplasmatales bacterium]
MNNRILLKLSGEALAGPNKFGIDPKTVTGIAEELKEVTKDGYQIAIVVGGGNIWRGQGAAELGMDRSQADYMGMMATIMNGLALQDSLEAIGVSSRVQTALHVDQVAEPYIRRRTIRHLEKDRVVILAGGTGMPYFTTDSNTMLRASELNINLVLMAKNGVDGVYDKDPNKHDDATRYETLTYKEILEKQLKVMDLTASSLADENGLTTIVFNMNEKGNILKVLKDNSIGTIIK